MHVCSIHFTFLCVCVCVHFNDYSVKYLQYRDVTLCLCYSCVVGFLYFWGIVFLFSTTLVAVFKKEYSSAERHIEAEPNLGVAQTYRLLWNITQLPSIRTTALILLTSKVRAYLLNCLKNEMDVLFPLSHLYNNNLSLWHVCNIFVLFSVF
jgi:hypothetical protein